MTETKTQETHKGEILTGAIVLSLILLIAILFTGTITHTKGYTKGWYAGKEYGENKTTIKPLTIKTHEQKQQTKIKTYKSYMTNK